MRKVLTLLLLMTIASWAEPAAQLRASGLPDHEVYPYFNASGSHLTLDAHDELRVWDLSHFRLLKHTKVKGLISHDLSPDGRYLAISSRPRKIQVLDLRSGEPVFNFSGLKPTENEGAYSISFSPNGEYLSAFGSGGARENCDRTLRVWRTADWQRVGMGVAKETRWWGWLEVKWTPWNQLAHLQSEGKELDLYDPVGLHLARTVPLELKGINLRSESEALVVISAGEVDEIALQRLGSADTEPSLERHSDGQTLGERRVTRVADNLWMLPNGYGGPTTFYAGQPLEGLGSLRWACPTTLSRDGRLLALATREGVLILDLEKTLSQGKLTPYKP